MNDNATGVLEMSNGSTVESPSEEQGATMRSFVTLAAQGLVPMFDESRQLFCYSLKKTSGGMVRDGLSPRYTLMTLMGLHRLEAAGEKSPIEIEPVLAGLLKNLDWIKGVGDLGLVLWTCALLAPDRLAELEGRIELETVLSRYPSATRGVTMELAWLLTGLTNWALACADVQSRLQDVAYRTFVLLKKNCGGHGFFGHLARDKSLEGKMRGRIGSFADQVYPIYAMTRFAQAFHEESALHLALQCGRDLCDAQGPLGQWWWHYDSITGRVVEGYPVFSVHQHAMGPMTLFALGEAAESDFTPWIYKGLKWIANNELDFNMKDDSANVIWRCQQRRSSRIKTYLKAALNPASVTVPFEKKEDLEVLFECRPYELGWLLYALAPRCALNRSAASSEK